VSTVRMSYAELLRDPRWQRLRLYVMERDGWACVYCKASHRNLQVHHKHYEKGLAPWEYPASVLVTACEDCHGRITDLKKRADEVIGEMTPDELVDAIDHLGQFRTVTLRPLAAVLERCHEERNEIISRPYSTEASRRLEVIDALEAHISDVIEAVPATSTAAQRDRA